MRWLVFLFLLSCTPDPVPEAPRISRAQLLVDADARVATPLMSLASRSVRVEERRAATLAFARLQSPAASASLRAALRDTDSIVRTYGSLGVGSLERLASEADVAALVGAFVAEEDPPSRRAMLEDLGRVATREHETIFFEALSDSRLTGSACKALARMGMNGLAALPATLARVAEHVGDEREVALDCLFALTRLPPGARDVVVARLVSSAASEDTALRVMSVRALGGYPNAPIDLLVRAARDPNWRVGVYAVSALSRRDRRSVIRVFAPELDPRVVHAALEALIPLAREAEVIALAQDWQGELAGDLSDPWRARAHCTAARLVDHGRGWPHLLEQCGGEVVEAYARKVWQAEVVAGVSGADSQRAAYLTRLYEDESSVVKQAVVRAAAEIVEARPLVERASQTNDRGLLNAMLESLAEHEVDGTADLVRAALPSLRNPDDLEGLQSALTVIERRRLPFAPLVAELATHENVALRRKSRAVAESLGVVVPDAALAPSSNPIEVGVVERATTRVAITLDTGMIEIELMTREAPTTSARFLALVERGFYDGLKFHRVIPGFVAQAGDPRGDGYGGPGFSQRCEDNRVDYVRGTVGMALAGRDTGGSQFFIAHSAQPHLDGRYTVFGRVVSGMAVVDVLTPGAVMRTVRVSRETN